MKEEKGRGEKICMTMISHVQNANMVMVQIRFFAQYIAQKFLKFRIPALELVLNHVKEKTVSGKQNKSMDIEPLYTNADKFSVAKLEVCNPLMVSLIRV